MALLNTESLSVGPADASRATPTAVFWWRTLILTGMMGHMLADLWPQYGLTIVTPRSRDVAAWRLGIGMFYAARPIGVVTLRARDFPVVRQVTTSSWLGMRYQEQGYGIEAGRDYSPFAFDHLSANAALTEVFQDNHSSQGVSRKLGCEHDGISVDARGGEVVISDRLRLTVRRWRQQEGFAVTIGGMDVCRASFGLCGAAAVTRGAA